MSPQGYAHGTTVYRDRREPVVDPFNPDRPTLPDWADYDIEAGTEDGTTIEVKGVYVAASSTTAVPDAVRTRSSDYKSLYCRDRNVDVAIGDRIRSDGFAYYVETRPQGDINPFTGWAPGVEIPLRGEIG